MKNNPTKTVVFIHKNLTIGGVETVLVNYLAIFAKHFRVHLVLQQNNANNVHLPNLPTNVALHYLLTPAESDDLDAIERRVDYLDDADFLAIRETMRERMLDFFRKNPCDLAVNFNTHLDFFLERYRLHIPVIRWLHGFSSLELWHGSPDYYQPILARHSAIIAINDEMKSYADWVLAKLHINLSVFRLYNPLDLAQIAKKSHETTACQEDLARLKQPFLLQVARLEKGKNHALMIQIFARLKQLGIKHKLYIIGDGAERENLAQLIDELGLADDCLLLGERTNPYPFMKNAELFLHTSAHEGLPSVLIESMVCGTPVVAMACRTGVREILGNGQFGALIRESDADGFIKAVYALLTEPERQHPFRQKLAKSVERFDIPEVERAVKELFSIV